MLLKCARKFGHKKQISPTLQFSNLCDSQANNPNTHIQHLTPSVYFWLNTQTKKFPVF